MSSQPKLFVVVLTYNSEADLEDCFSSLRKAVEGLDCTVIAVDNASKDGTATRLRERFAWVERIENTENLGFAGGNNVGMRAALERGADYVYLLNPDTIVEPGFLREAVTVAEADPLAGAVQSLLLLASEPELVNTAGNTLHYLGFGSCGRYREPASSVAEEPVEITAASGASVLYRASALREVGLLDEKLFLYHEDLDLSLRLRLSGHRVLLAPKSRVLHKYTFSKSPRKFYFLERNRYLVLLKHLEAKSLLWLAPFLLGSEPLLLLYAAKGGWLKEKLRADWELLQPQTLGYVLRERANSKALRKISDRELVPLLSSGLEFEEVATPFIKKVANPLLGLVWERLKRRL